MNQNRIARVIENMRLYGLDQILVSATPSVYYLSGFWVAPGERMLALYLNTDGDVRLYANRLFALSEGAKKEGLPLTEYDDTEDCVGLLAADLRPGKLGIDKLWHSRFTIELMQRRGDLQLVHGSMPVDDARMCKDARELELMRQSSRMNDEATARTIAAIHAGMSETELAAAYAGFAKELGARGNSFEGITCFGANCAEPHHDNDDTIIKPGDSVIIDVGLWHEHYASDMTRTVFFGKVSDEQKKVYELVRRANEAGRAAVRPGLPMSEFDRAARKVIEEGGYGEYFIHRTGHGIGLEVHEPPDNSATSRVIAKPGMCFSVEPGIYLPGKFGVRIEDLVAVTQDGCETLNALGREMVAVSG